MLKKILLNLILLVKNVNFLSKIKNTISFKVTHNIKNSIIQILKDINSLKKKLIQFY